MTLEEHTHTHTGTHRHAELTRVVGDEAPLMESPCCHRDSLTFEVMLYTHYSTGRLREEEELRNGCVERLHLSRVKGKSESCSH